MAVVNDDTLLEMAMRLDTAVADFRAGKGDPLAEVEDVAAELRSLLDDETGAMA